jgi:hypothetical protein
MKLEREPGLRADIHTHHLEPRLVVAHGRTTTAAEQV